MHKGDSFIVDGGTVANLPLQTADLTGAQIVVGVRLHSQLDHVNKKQFDTNYEYANRIVSLLMKAIEQKSIEDADVLIQPKIENIGMDSFDKEDIKKAIAEGEKATIDALPAIKDKLKESLARKP